MQENKEKIIKALKQILERTKLHSFDDVDKIYESVEYLEFKEPALNIVIARNFIEAWVDEANHNFHNMYKGIKKDDWPKLTANLLDSLVADKNELPKVLEQFDYRKDK